MARPNVRQCNNGELIAQDVLLLHVDEVLQRTEEPNPPASVVATIVAGLLEVEEASSVWMEVDGRLLNSTSRQRIDPAAGTRFWFAKLTQQYIGLLCHTL